MPKNKKNKARAKAKRGTNQHGLPRHIPPEIKAQIRREAGFGCVICGVVYAQYEHIEPEYNDARSHDPAHMTLLCGHCHDRVTRKLWSKDKVWNAKREPMTFRKGECRESLDLATPLIVHIGSNIFDDFGNILRAPTWQFKLFTPADPSSPPELYFPIQDSVTGKEVMRIEGNDLIGYVPGCFDIKAEGPKISLFDATGRCVLGMRAKPPRELYIEDLYLHAGRGMVVEVQKGGPLQVFYENGAKYAGSIDGMKLGNGGPHQTAIALGEEGTGGGGILWPFPE